MRQYATVTADLILFPSVAMQGTGEQQGRENYLQGISESRTTSSSWPNQENRSGLGGRSREYTPAHA